MKIVLIGPPLSGKGSLAKLLTHKKQFLHISTGDLFREEIAAGSVEGKEAKGFMDAGKLVPDELTLSILQKRIHTLPKDANIVFDGFPRTTRQAEEFAKIVKLDKVIYFDVSDEVLYDRLLGRITCPQCGTPYHLSNAKPKVAGICDHCKAQLVHRSDDNLEAFKIRLEAFKEMTAPVILYYQQQGLLEKVDGGQDSALLLERLMGK